MYLTEKHTGEAMDVPWQKILDYEPIESGSRILLGNYPEEEDLSKTVWIEVAENPSEIDEIMMYGQ